MKEITGTTVRRRYARLPLALALGALVLTPAVIGFGTATAEASVAGKGETSITLSGDARLRGFWQEDADFGGTVANPNADDTNRQLQHRMRIALDAKAAGGTSLHTRFHMANNGMDTWGAADNLNVATDYLYVRVPVGDVAVTTGRQVVNWGHRMKAWDTRADRLRADYKISDELALFAYLQQNREASPADPKDEDTTAYAIGVNYGTPDLRVVLQLRHTDDQRDSVAAPANHAQFIQGENGQEIYGFVTAKIADLTLTSEFDYRLGDIHATTNYVGTNPNDEQPYAIYVGAAYALGDTTLTAGVAYAGNRWTSPGAGHFDQITMFYNTSGGHGLGHSLFGTNSDDGELALGVGASHKLTPELTLGGKLAYIDAGNVGNNQDLSFVVADAGMAYKVNASTTYHIDAIYASPSFDNPALKDDAYWGLSHRFEITF